MPNFIVLRLTPASPVHPDTFTNSLDGLTIKVYDISSAHSRAGLPGDATPPIGTAVYNTPTPSLGVPFVPGGIYVTYPAGTNIAQHYTLQVALGDVVGIDFESVATAVIPSAGGVEYVTPDLRVEFDRAGATPLRDSNPYYDVELLNVGTAPDPANYQQIQPPNISAYLALPAALQPGLGQLILPADGSPPNYDDLMAAVTAVLSKDPGVAVTPAEIGALTADQCKNIAFEIIWGPQPPMPQPSEAIESMYTNPPNDGSNANSNEQSRQDFQGKLNSYYSTNNAAAQRLTNFVYSLAAAVWCEQQTQAATSAIVSFPVNPNPTKPPTLTTVGEAHVIFTGAINADVPAEFFYALTAQMPTQISPAQRYQLATTSAPNQIVTLLTNAVNAGTIAMPPSAPQPNLNPAQAARLLNALALPAGSTATKCPVANIQPIWPDWLAFAGSDISTFWPAEEAAQQGHYLDLVLFVLTQGYVDAVTAVLLAIEIKANLLFTPGAPPPVHIQKTADLASATPADWTNFFGQPIQVNLLPDFTLPGTPQARVTAFIKYVQKFFDMPASPAAIGPVGADAPGFLHLPTFDLIQQCIGTLVFGMPLTAADLTNLNAAAATVLPGDPEAQQWLVQTIVDINNVAIFAKIPAQPASFQFSVMEALYARGFTTPESILDLPLDNFQPALTGTVAYDFASVIYANAGVAGGFPSPGGGFGPINPGNLVDCIPPPYLSPLGPVEYLAEMLRLSEASTCEAPFAPPPAGHSTLETAIASRRGPLGLLAASKANLETPLPLIDIVNECLESMASVNPPAKQGVVYNTSADSLAGHELCSDVCCCGGKGCAECHPQHGEPPNEGVVDLDACHQPAVLYDALPEYSTPGVPVAANAAVEPAVYNILRNDFSSCCLPYSQALDISRTYLRHFDTCRFEEMRTFRRCITEFVLDPENEPAAFQNHLWRYPVRIDIAMEYLGITPEEYSTLFHGAPAAPCGPQTTQPPPPPPINQPPGVSQPPGVNQPPGINIHGVLPSEGPPPVGISNQPPANTITGTGEVNRLAIPLPDFLKAVCLTYCEFIDLWKTGFVQFSAEDRNDGKFPDCEPCCLADYDVHFPGGEGRASAVEEIFVFVRLWHKLKQHCCGGYTFAQLQDICSVLKLFTAIAINPDFIRQLAAFQLLRDHFKMSLTDRRSKTPANVNGSARTHLLALWDPAASPAIWDWAVQELIERIKRYAECKHECRPRDADFLKLLADNLDPLSKLAGFDPADPAATWHTNPAHTLRFAEMLAKIYASNFGIGEILFLFTAGTHSQGDDPFPLEAANEALDVPLDLPDDERERALLHLRRKLLTVPLDDEAVHHWTWHRIEAALHHDFDYPIAEIAAFGEHFFPGVLEHAGHPVSPDKRRWTSPLAAGDTRPLMWNTPAHLPFTWDAGELWTRLPLADEGVLEQLTHVAELQPKEQTAVQDLYFQPRAMLARFALIFEDFAEAAARLIQEDEDERWRYFRWQFALFERRCRIIAEHLTHHVAAATGQEHPEGLRPAFLVLGSLLADENENQPGSNWESDSGDLPPVKWSPAPNGAAFAALLGLTGTGLIAEFTPADASALVWREPSHDVGGFGRARNHLNCPVPAVLPALDATLTSAQERFVSVHNGLAVKDSTGAVLGGATGFRVKWSGALLVDKGGTYEFHARAPRRKEAEDEEPGRRRWCVTVRRGQRSWVVARRHWPGEPDIHSGHVPLREGAYDLIVEFEQPTPLFNEEDDIFAAHTGLEVEYSGPDTGNERMPIPHRNLLLVDKDQPLGDGLTGLSNGAASYLSQCYVSSLRDIRRTYQRAFKALLFVHRFALSAEPRAGGQSELGYMLTHEDNFAGASYHKSAAGYVKHNADFNFNLLPVGDDYHPPTGDSRTSPSPQRMQALFDWWERVFDYTRVRADVERDCDRHVWLLWAEAAEKHPAHPGYLLRWICADSRHWQIDLTYFQNQFAPVYHATSDDLEDDRWTVRAWHADRWIRRLLRSFRAKDIEKARPDLWASDDPSAVLPGETVTGNANLSQFLQDGLIETGAPRRYEVLKKLNDGLRERGRHALLCYLCGPGGIAESPKQISQLLLLDVEAELCEKVSRTDEAISAVQTFIQSVRLNLEPGWIVSKEFALLWDRKFRTYHDWEACKRRELYKENWIEWCELKKAEKIDAFRFLDEQLRRVTLTVAAPGGVDYWPDQLPPMHPGIQLLQKRDVDTMQLLPQPREGLDLLASPERAGRPSWLTDVPEPSSQIGGNNTSDLPRPGIAGRATGIAPAAGGATGAGASSGSANGNLPYWMEAAIALGTRFIRIDAAGYPPAFAPFKPRKEHHPKDEKSCCVNCCTECGCEHPPHMDEFYFWLVDGNHFGPQTQDPFYDQNLQVSTPWHDCQSLTSLLNWPADPLIRLAWCRVHNGEFQQPRRSDFGIPYTAGGTLPDLNFKGRIGDSLYFETTVPPTALAPDPGFRYDLATDTAARLYDLAIPAGPPVPYPGGIIAYPFFAYFAPGARLFPWSSYAPALAVAHALRSHCRFEAALKWYALAYDPLNEDNTWMICLQDTQTQPGTQNLPGDTGTVLAPGGTPAAAMQRGSLCCDSTDVSCLVARDRSILLHYLETLLQWGDAAMRRNSPEAFQHARLIFDTMAKIMGKHPKRLWDTPPATTQTVHDFVPLYPPLNPRLMTLYDRLDDRLAMIHHCINARRFRNGHACPVPYFGNDPFRDGWKAETQPCFDESDWCHPVSPYRFLFLAQKARELTSRARELGNSLLSLFEKGDAEYLAAMRTRHEREIASLTIKAREDQWRDADWQVQALGKTKENRQNDRRYYAQLIANGLINNETQYLSQTDIAQGDRAASIAMETVAEAMDIIPDLFVGFPCEETWLPVGTKLAGMFRTIARISSILAEIASAEGSRDLTQAGWDRRLQEWVHRVELLDIEIEQIELQILGAERRRAQNLRELNVQQAMVENPGEVQDFLRDKFTSHAVYLVLQKETAGLYWRMYELARYAALQAQRAFNIERGHTTRHFLPVEGWDNLREGLLAADRLDAVIAHMEKEYLDLNVREEELTKHISLKMNFPAQFLQLKITGRCEFQIPEWMFDQDYPGHYMRRVKNVSLTIPAVGGPYTGVHCRLTLLASTTRIDPMLIKPAEHCCGQCKHENFYEACPHDPRVVRQYGAREAIATSSGRNDTGMFELNFRDERYLPFEYQGAVSCWRIDLPQENNFFDTDTVTDVILHMNYTAREGGDLLHRAANEAARKWLPGACWTVFDIRHDFAGAWEQFRSDYDSRELVLTFNRTMFPFVPCAPEIRVDRLAFLFEAPCEPDERCVVPECPCPEDPDRDAYNLEVVTSRSGHEGGHEDEERFDEEDITCVSSADSPELYYGVMAVRFGPFETHSRRRHEVRFRFPPHVGLITRAYLFCHYCVHRPDDCCGDRR
jgi:hypothetical protein